MPLPQPGSRSPLAEVTTTNDQDMHAGAKILSGRVTAKLQPATAAESYNEARRSGQKKFEDRGCRVHVSFCSGCSGLKNVNKRKWRFVGRGARRGLRKKARDVFLSPERKRWPLDQHGFGRFPSRKRQCPELAREGNHGKDGKYGKEEAAWMTFAEPEASASGVGERGSPRSTPGTRRKGLRVEG
jgi:hypothetical protein